MKRKCQDHPKGKWPPKGSPWRKLCKRKP